MIHAVAIDADLAAAARRELGAWRHRAFVKEATVVGVVPLARECIGAWNAGACAQPAAAAAVMTKLAAEAVAWRRRGRW